MRQDYKEVPLFPIRCWSFNAPDDLTRNTAFDLKELEYRNYNSNAGVGTSKDITKLPQFYDIHEWFQHCVDTVHADNSWTCDRLVVNKSWSNRSDAHSGHHHFPHRHPMSFLSGIWYATKGTPTCFIDPVQQREWSQFFIDGGPVSEGTQYINPVPGCLFLFPRYLIHSSEPNNTDHNRFSIAFNTFPNGSINRGGWDLPMAQVKVDGWKDLGPLELSKFLK